MTGTDLSRLRADCARCVALCCIAPALQVSADFAIDKPAGRPCPNLRPDFRCSIHDELRPRGFPGCTAYDCFGAGQRVAQETFGGRDWRRAPDIARAMFDVFAVVRQLHELLWFLADALTRPAAEPLRSRLLEAQAETERLAAGDRDSLLALDVGAHRATVATVLAGVSELVRASAGATLRGADLVGADLVGAKLRGVGLVGADLRGALLIGADLTGADLRQADLIGADLRGAELSGANLATSLFLSRSQIGAARGDRTTRLPAALEHPAHWQG